MESLLAFDEARADALLDRLVAAFSTDGLLQEVLLPVLRELGERWGVGDVSIAQEHFATNVLRGRMTALGRGWGQGRGPVAVLACPEGELHDLPLVAFGLALRARGWRITFLGGDTPVAAVAEAARLVSPAIVVVAGEIPGHLQAAADQLAALAREAPLAVAGAAATPELALRTGATLLRDDPVEAAERLSAAPAARAADGRVGGRSPLGTSRRSRATSSGASSRHSPGASPSVPRPAYRVRRRPVIG